MKACILDKNRHRKRNTKPWIETSICMRLKHKQIQNIQKPSVITQTVRTTDLTTSSFRSHMLLGELMCTDAGFDQELVSQVSLRLVLLLILLRL